ncbi:MAG: UDP-N-acetylmuramoyl-L-alanyl-D-glutamate--2,6-diaminopimelate ligase [Phycisphaerae bacterium]
MLARELILRALNLSMPTGVEDFDVTGITADSRQVQPGYIFVAVAGTKFDGANFACQAVEKGARLVISHRKIENLPLIVAEKVNLALAKMAWAYYGIDELQTQGKLSLHGVTGTNGKTTFCYIFQYLANQFGRKCARFGTIEYDLISKRHEASHTTPDTMQLASLIRQAYDNGADSIVMEVSSHALDQGRAAGLKFSTAAFTNLTGDHLDYHGTMENYLSAKLLLFKSLPADGSAIVNIDDPAAKKVLQACSCKKISYGIDSNDADLAAKNLELTAAGTKGTIQFHGQSVPFSSPYIGKHNVYNILAAVGSVVAMGFDLSRIADLIKTIPTVPGRLERVPNAEGFEIFVDYAHTDDGLVNVLSALKPLVTNKLILVFGCGGDRDRTKRPRMAGVAEQYADTVIVTSDNPRTENPDRIILEIMAGFSCHFRPEVQVEPDRAHAIRTALDQAEPGDIVLLAGKGHEDYQIIGTTKIHFDDREECRKWLAEKSSAKSR